MNNIINILNKNSVDILQLLSKGNFYLREISETLHISPSATHGALKSLLAFDFIKESKQKNKKVYSLNTDNILLRAVKSFINLDRIIKSKAYKGLSTLGTVGIYGSFAEGSNDEHSDLDMWVYGEKINPSLAAKYSAKFEKEFKAEINILILNKNKLENIKNKDPEFYSRLKLTSVYQGEAPFD